ncbi:hypothetical protein SRABI05_00099 [Agrobacterium fabrum]|uniref:hypothetical protein n=1 Tax=Agrobacterium fabrum TaxID=1176649 RepID=UPI001D9B4AB6|nr:hypothetical protein [Agrobacterium fabrum]CAH0133205.1 hypothetical protein SRABI05_00099 [Agrobacterium fabrum]CAH0152677.1 hypothetical protein SRABI46_00814 [Agrobacterium fabrum]
MTAPIEKAAVWLSEQKETPNDIIHILRDKFEITASEAAQACTLANKFRTDRRARG